MFRDVSGHSGVPGCSGVPWCSVVFRGVPVFRCSGVPVFRCSGVPMFRCSGVLLFLLSVHAVLYVSLAVQEILRIFHEYYDEISITCALQKELYALFRALDAAHSGDMSHGNELT